MKETPKKFHHIGNTKDMEDLTEILITVTEGKIPKMTYRNSLQIMTSVLDNMSNAGMDGLTVSQIILKSNISHSRLQKLVHNLSSSGLVNKIEYEKKQTFVITEKGRLLLQEYKKFSDLAGIFGLEM